MCAEEEIRRAGGVFSQPKVLLVSDSIAEWRLREHRVVADELVWPVGQ